MNVEESIFQSSQRVSNVKGYLSQFLVTFGKQLKCDHIESMCNLYVSMCNLYVYIDIDTYRLHLYVSMCNLHVTCIGSLYVHVFQHSFFSMGLLVIKVSTMARARVSTLISVESLALVLTFMLKHDERPGKYHFRNIPEFRGR